MVCSYDLIISYFRCEFPSFENRGTRFADSIINKKIEAMVTKILQNFCRGG